MDGEANETKRICRLPAHGISHGNLKQTIEVSNTDLLKLLEPDQNIDSFWTVLIGNILDCAEA